MIINRDMDANVIGLLSELSGIPGMILPMPGRPGELMAHFSMTYTGERPNISIELNIPDDLVDSVNTVLDNHDPNILTVDQEDDIWAQESLENVKTLPEWSTWSPSEAENVVTSMILNGWTKQQISDYINTNVTNITTAKQAMILLAHSIVDIRNILSVIAKIIIHFRRIWIRRQ